MTQAETSKLDWLHWAKRLKSEIALKFLVEGAVDEPKLAEVLQRHVEVGNVIRTDVGLELNPRAERDSFGGLVRF